MVMEQMQSTVARLVHEQCNCCEFSGVLHDKHIDCIGAISTGPKCAGGDQMLCRDGRTCGQLCDSVRDCPGGEDELMCRELNLDILYKNTNTNIR